MHWIALLKTIFYISKYGNICHWILYAWNILLVITITVHYYSVYIRMKKLKAAIHDCDKACHLNPDAATGYKFRGKAKK